MQRESYRDNGIAKFLNKHFVPVKVDRELESALDARMIEFVESIHGIAGWPLNVFITPEGYPLYAVLYLPPERFLAVLERVQELWTRDRERLLQLAARVNTRADGPGRPQLDLARVRSYAGKVEDWALTLADPINGGFGEGNKFPSVPQLEFLLARWESAQDPRLKEFLILTLDQMANLGLYDHLGGGFFRYTVDPGWEMPHFEKMLYDNALLAQLYLRAARAFDRPAYENVALHSLEFMIKELRTDSGGFMASLSAVDDQDVEGGYYLWHADDLVRLLDAPEHQAYRLAWRMTDAAPFDNGYLPIKGMESTVIAKQMGITETEVDKLLASAARKLSQARAQRVLPKDTKLLAGWNGLALSAFAYAARVTGDQRYRRVARGIRDYVMETLWDGTSLRRAERQGNAVGQAALEDYAYLAHALFAWARLTGRDGDYAQAATVARQAWKRFYGPSGWRLAETSLIQPETGQDLVLDGPMPSPSGVLARVSLELAAHRGDAALRDKALSALNSGHAQLEENPLWNATQVAAMLAHMQAR